MLNEDLIIDQVHLVQIFQEQFDEYHHVLQVDQVFLVFLENHIHMEENFLLLELNLDANNKHIHHLDEEQKHQRKIIFFTEFLPSKSDPEISFGCGRLPCCGKTIQSTRCLNFGTSTASNVRKSPG